MKLCRHRVLNQIRRTGAVGRLELGRQLRMGKSRVCDIVQEMLEQGLLLENSRKGERRGRRPILVRTNPEHGLTIGLDFEARRMRVVIVDFSGEVRWKEQSALQPGIDRTTLIEKILAGVERGLVEARAMGIRPLGIGIAAPGIIDRKSGSIIHYDLMEEARDIPLRDLVAAQTLLPCIMDNNIRSYALTESMSGSAQHLNSFICLGVRSGVGAAIMQDGKLLEGSHGFSGQAGYAVIPTGHGVANWKHLHNVVSEKALELDVESHEWNISPRRAQRAGELIGAYIASMVSLIDPQAVVLAGALVQPDSPLWPWLERSYRQFILSDIEDRVPLLPSRAGPYAAAVGAAHRCFEKLYPVDPWVEAIV